MSIITESGAATPGESDLSLRWALHHASLRWYQIPIWWTENGRCACGDPACPSPGKHPIGSLVPNGEKDATIDPEVIRSWFVRYPRMNIAVCTGPSNLIAIDTDSEEGEEAWLQFVTAVGVDLLPPIEARTGGLGTHRLWSCGDAKLKSVNRFLPGADLKCRTGYIVVSPSIHRSGNYYLWRTAVTMAPPMHEAMLAALAIRRGGAFGEGGRGDNGDQPEYDYRRAKEEGAWVGIRDHFFNAYAFEMKKTRVALEDAVKLMREAWERCDNPEDDSDPNHIAWSVALLKVKGVYDNKDIQPDETPQHWPAGIEWNRPSSPPDALEIKPPKALDNDTGNAWRLVVRHGNNFRWLSELDQNYPHLIWDSERAWVQDKMDRLHEWALDTVDAIFVKECPHPDDVASDDEKRMKEHARKSLNRYAQDQMIRTADRSFPQVKAELTDFDQNPSLFGFLGGVVNLRTGEVREHRREDLIMRISPVRIDLNARDERWDRYVRSTFQDEEERTYAQRVCGCCLTPALEKLFWVLLGGTDSGKTAFANALLTVSGSYGMALAIEKLMHSSITAMDDYTRASFQGMRVAVAEESDESARFNEGSVKDLTGGGRLDGRHPYGRRFTFSPTFKLLIPTNYEPRVRDMTVFSRLRVIPFLHQIPREAQDRTLRDELKDPNAPVTRAAAAWFVQGAMDYLSRGLGTSKLVEDATAAYRADQDVLQRFIEERLEKAPGLHVNVHMTDVYIDYRLWMEMRGERDLLGQAQFTSKLKNEYKLPMGRSNGTILKGYQLRNGPNLAAHSVQL